MLSQRSRKDPIVTRKKSSILTAARYMVFVSIVIVMVTFITSESTNERTEMFDLTTHSTHFIYGYMASH